MDAILTLVQPTPAPSNLDPVAEAHHRIANSLTLLVSMLRMQTASVKTRAQSYSSAEVRHLLDGVAARIGTISQLHRILSRIGNDGVTSLKPHLQEVTDALTAALSSPEQQQVRVLHTGCDCQVLTRHVQPIVLILCEIFVNAMKYAHPAGVPLIIIVECEPAADGQMILTVSDDGVGLPEGFEPERDGGMGFKMMQKLAEAIGGQFEIRSTHLGLSLRLSLPASTVAGAKLA